MDMVLEDWQGYTWKQLEDVEELSLVAVAPVGELYWEFSGEPVV